MARIDIQGGLERDEFYDKNDNLIGVAEYDLNDAGVRLRVLEFADSMETRWQEFTAIAETMPKVTLEDKIAQTRLEVEFVERLNADADNVFGVDFCAKAIGSNCRNILTLLEVLEGIVTKYGAQPNMQMDKFVAGTKNREQKRIEKHGRGIRK